MMEQVLTQIYRDGAAAFIRGSTILAYRSTASKNGESRWRFLRRCEEASSVSIRTIACRTSSTDETERIALSCSLETDC